MLLAVTATLLAGKLEEEVIDPTIEDVLKHCPLRSLTDKDVRRMERKLLVTLDWEVQTVTPYSIMYALGAAVFPDIPDLTDIVSFASFYLTHALNNADSLRYLPSTQAASALLTVYRDLSALGRFPSSRYQSIDHLEVVLADMLPSPPLSSPTTHRHPLQMSPNGSSVSAISSLASCTSFLGCLINFTPTAGN
jgi:hypothetical protein